MDYEALGRYTAELERVRAAQYRRNALLHNLGVAAARTAADGRRWLYVGRQLQSRGAGLRLDTPKTEAGKRELPIMGTVLPALLAHLAEHVGKDAAAPLFPRTARGDDHLHPNVLRSHFKAAITAANTDDKSKIPTAFVFHGLRHTAMTRLGVNGATMAELKAFAGHSDDATVAKYQWAGKERLAALADKAGGEES